MTGGETRSTEVSVRPQTLGWNLDWEEFDWEESGGGAVHCVVGGGDRWCVFIGSRSDKTKPSIHTEKPQAELRRATHLVSSNIESVPKSEAVLLASAWFIMTFVGVIGVSLYLFPLCEAFYEVALFSGSR